MTCRFCRHSSGSSWDRGNTLIQCKLYPEWRDVPPKHICGQFYPEDPSDLARYRNLMNQYSHWYEIERKERMKYQKLAKERFRKIQELKAKLKSKSAQESGTQSPAQPAAPARTGER